MNLTDNKRAVAGWSRKLKGLMSSVKIGECTPTFSYILTTKTSSTLRIDGVVPDPNVCKYQFF